MNKSRFSEAQMVAETCRKHGTSDSSNYKRKSQFACVTASHLSQLRHLQAANAKKAHVR